jgi:hypothetical protein
LRKSSVPLNYIPVRVSGCVRFRTDENEFPFWHSFF